MKTVYTNLSIGTIFLLLNLLVSSCSTSTTSKEEVVLPKVVCTTGMIGDVVQAIGGNTIQLNVLMGPGVDPHLYKATQGDMKKMSEADLIFYNGLHLEGRMSEIFEQLSTRKTVKAISEKVPTTELRMLGLDGKEVADPHIWFDVKLWIYAARTVEETLISKYPNHTSVYKENAKIYVDSLLALDTYIHTSIQKIPENKRILVTSHDAFGYFGQAYGIEVRALQGISTASESGLQDITQLVDYICEKDIPAVFLETSVSEKALKSVIYGVEDRGKKVEMGGTLYTDAMGEEGTVEGTYIGMLRKNVDTIVTALTKAAN